MIRVVHYINQFFAGVGGEEKADYQPETREGAVGPGLALNAAFKARLRLSPLLSAATPTSTRTWRAPRRLFWI